MMKRPLAFWILLVFLFQITAPTWVLAQAGGRFEVTINARSLNVRSGPGTDFDILGSVSQGDKVVGLREDSGWVQIETPAGAIGWISKQFVIIGPAITESTSEPTREVPATPPPRTTPPPAASRSTSSGGIGFGGIIKWTSLVGAVALGGLAYNEKSQGDDTYDEYSDAALEGDTELADTKWQETADHDDKAQLYGIVAGSLFGLFLLQQFVFKGSSDTADRDEPGAFPGGFAYDPRTGDLRASLLQVRF
jgi:uncharacterized protein YgiM (DUF1202 family)